MKACFIYDVRMVKAEDNQYYSQILDYSIWKRYLQVFDSLIITTRVADKKNILESEQKGLKLSSGPAVEFKSIIEFDSRLDLMMNYRKIRRKLREILQETDCAIIRLPSILGIMACHEAIKMKKMWTTEMVGCVWDSLWNHGSMMGKFAAPVMYLLNRHYVGKSDYVLYVSNNFLQRRYPTKGKTANGISNVNISKPNELVLQSRLKKIEEGFKTPIRFGLIGSFNVNYKGHETSMRALASIKDEIPDFRLRMLGNGNHTRWYKLAESLGIQDKVEFCGMIPTGQGVLSWIDENDIHLTPSLQEGLPRALIEAMSRGCPAIGSDAGGIPELLPKQFIHHKKDHRQQAKIIYKLVNDKHTMLLTAKENFMNSQNYAKDNLDAKRTFFYREFYKKVEGSNKGV